VLVAVAVHGVQGAGEVYGMVSEQVGSAENVAVSEQAPPEGVKPGSVYVIGLVQGRGIVVLPPQLLVTVSVPDVGGYDKVICPVTEYVFVAGAQADGTAVNPVILHGIIQLVDPVVPAPVVAEMVPGAFE
jgi:hypothetical protein